MNRLPRLTLTFTNLFFDGEFETQWAAYIALHPTEHAPLLRRIVFGSCHSLITSNATSDGRLKEHHFDLDFPEVSLSYSVNLKLGWRKRYLVVDDLSPQLRLHPMHVPIPDAVFAAKEDDAKASLAAFTLKVYRDLMGLEYFEWDHSHSHDDIVIDAFDVRYDKIYPSIST